MADVAPDFASWRAIVESVLGDWVDAVIGEPQFLDLASGHFDANYKATRTTLVQSENVTSQDQVVRPGTLTKVVTT